LLILISNIRNFSQKDKVKKFYLELNSEWDNKFDFSFDFNYFLEPLVKSEIFVLAKNAPKSEFGSFLDLAPFGFLWYHESVDRTELERQLDFYQKEWERSNKILSNDDFRKKAPFHLIKKEEEKLIYYENQKKKILSKL
jgi:valyl-tRNA synthetase